MSDGEVTAAGLQRAMETVIEASLLGAQWDRCLPKLAEAAGAGGATLVRERNGVDLSVLCTASIHEPVAAYIKGATPPNPRKSPLKGAGFLTDFDQFTPEQISRHAFYREFLQPVGYGWHACAMLGDGARHEKLLLSLKRRHSHGHYQRRDIELLDTFLPMLRAAADCSRAVLDAEARGLGAAFEDRGDVILSLDARGRLLRHGDADGRLAEWGLQIIDGHLVAARDEQPRLARAIAAALGAPPRAGRAVLCTGDPAVRLLINVVPVVGLARDVFHAASAVLAIGVWRKPDAAPHALVRLLSETFGLTRSEARVAALVSSGLSLRESALRLGISVGTARHYSKAVLQKTRTARQSELAALVGHLKF